MLRLSYPTRVVYQMLHQEYWLGVVQVLLIGRNVSTNSASTSRFALGQISPLNQDFYLRVWRDLHFVAGVRSIQKLSTGTRWAGAILRIENSTLVSPTFERGRSEPTHSIFLHDHLLPATPGRIEEHVIVEGLIRL
jgi:hypothetical protein